MVSRSSPLLWGNTANFGWNKNGSTKRRADKTDVRCTRSSTSISGARAKRGEGDWCAVCRMLGQNRERCSRSIWVGTEREHAREVGKETDKAEMRHHIAKALIYGRRMDYTLLTCLMALLSWLVHIFWLVILSLHREWEYSPLKKCNMRCISSMRMQVEL